MSDHLTALDATFLELEQADDSAHMHIGALLVFEPLKSGGAPELELLRTRMEERLDVLPRYRQRLSEPHTGGLSWPEWVTDENFAIENHVHRAALPAPGEDREVVEWLGDYWSSRLDRNRPLWEVVLLEDLADGRWGLATKTHHALVDGVGSVEAGHLMLDTARRPRNNKKPGRNVAPAAEPSHDGLLRLLPGAVIGGVRTAAHLAVHPGLVREAVERSAALVDLIVRDELMSAPSSSLNVPISSKRRFEIVRADLDELKAVKRELGGTFNDVVLAATAGGLRRLLLSRGEDPPQRGLRAMVPVNVRGADDSVSLGNKITSLFVHLPVAEPEALRRYRLTVGEAESLKGGSQASGSATLIALTAAAPPMLHSALARALFASRLFNVTVTNVPGAQQPMYAFGARLEEAHPLVPIAADHAVGIAVVSYNGKVFFGLNGDDRAAADLDVLRNGIEESLAELSEVAGLAGKTERAAAE